MEYLSEVKDRLEEKEKQEIHQKNLKKEKLKKIREEAESIVKKQKIVDGTSLR